MEKLIELLNEYMREACKGKVIDENKINILSKKFGFIKRLVENDKIDIPALVEGGIKSGWELSNEQLDNQESEESWVEFFTEKILMLLAIQDNPIDFLCSILK